MIKLFKEIVIGVDEMLPVLTSTIYLPYRLQPNVSLKLPYTEFVKFLNWSVENEINLFARRSSAFLANTLKKGDEAIIRLFYDRLATTLTTELELAISKNEQCTRYMPVFDNPDTATSPSEEVVMKLARKLIDQGFDKERIVEILGSVDHIVRDYKKLTDVNQSVYFAILLTKLLSLAPECRRVNIYY